MTITIKQLSPDLTEDYLYFFDNMVFEENPDWSKCYCYSFHFTGTFEQWNIKDNRAAVIELIKEDKLRGYLAFSGKTPIGWCNANDRNNYQRLKSIYKLDDQIDKKICSIVCFVVNPEFRRKGIAMMLLERIIKDYKEKAYDLLEAYPGKGNLSYEKNYKGPVSLYEKNGFKTIHEKDKYYILRKGLK